MDNFFRHKECHCTIKTLVSILICCITRPQPPNKKKKNKFYLFINRRANIARTRHKRIRSHRHTITDIRLRYLGVWMSAFQLEMHHTNTTGWPVMRGQQPLWSSGYQQPLRRCLVTCGRCLRVFIVYYHTHSGNIIYYSVFINVNTVCKLIETAAYILFIPQLSKRYVIITGVHCITQWRVSLMDGAVH